MRHVALVASVVAMGGCGARAIENAPVDAHPPRDHVARVEGASLGRLERDMAALTGEARAELPVVYRRFVKGLPDGSALYFTVRVPVADAKFEQVFVRVISWRDGHVDGRLDSEPRVPGEIRVGDRLTFEDGIVLDWTIVLGDGTEQGNRLGHYLERGQ